ncbi:MAG: hypothetical protein U5L96_17220 [Owenweeksia sp.]|nr:hypothetical protein [Owenweeksia sp.]
MSEEFFNENNEKIENFNIIPAKISRNNLEFGNDGGNLQKQGSENFPKQRISVPEKAVYTKTKTYPAGKVTKEQSHNTKKRSSNKNPRFL